MHRTVTKSSQTQQIRLLMVFRTGGKKNWSEWEISAFYTYAEEQEILICGGGWLVSHQGQAYFQ